MCFFLQDLVASLLGGNGLPEGISLTPKPKPEEMQKQKSEKEEQEEEEEIDDDEEELLKIDEDKK